MSGSLSRPALLNKALQLTWRSAFQSKSGSILASTLGVLATVGGLCHAAERRSVRQPEENARPRGPETRTVPADAPCARYSCRVGVACGNVRYMRSEAMQQRRVVVVVAREGRAD